MNKVARLRQAAKICWLLSALATAIFFHKVLEPLIADQALRIVVVAALAASVQYILTLIESALFDGTLPPPWKINWREGGPLPWLVSGAIVCLVVDVFLNVGGVFTFTSQFDSADAKEALNLSAALMSTLESVMTLLLSIVIAVGSELLDEFANYVETGTSRASMKQKPRQDQQPSREQQRKEAEAYERQVAEQQRLSAERERLQRQEREPERGQSPRARLVARQGEQPRRDARLVDGSERDER